MSAGEWEPIVTHPMDEGDWADGVDWSDGFEGDGFSEEGVEAEEAYAHEHVANCEYCPVCHLIGAFREAAPEVGEQLGAAVSALFGAAKAAMDAYERHNTAQHGGRTSHIQHIDIE